MTITKTTTLKCNHCGKEVSFTGECPELLGPYRIKGLSPPDQPRNWYKIEPNYRQSIWMTSDFSIVGDFCSPECMRDYTTQKIDKRDNPPQSIQVGGLSVWEGKAWKGLTLDE